MKPVRTMPIRRGQPDTKYMLEQNAKVLSNVSFGTTPSNNDGDMNVKCWKASGTTPGANVEFAVKHGLKHVPMGFMVVSTDKAAHIFKSTTAWTAATNSSQGSIYLKCDVTTVAFVIVIL